MSLQSFWKITVVIPLESDADESSSLIPSHATKNCHALSKMIQLIKDSDPIGRTGNYIGVYGLFLRSGGYTPTLDANPVKGEACKDEEGLCYDLVTYADKSVTSNELSLFSDKVAQLHPWEHPTIEISEIDLWMPK